MVGRDHSAVGLSCLLAEDVALSAGESTINWANSSRWWSRLPSDTAPPGGWADYRAGGTVATPDRPVG